MKVVGAVLFLLSIALSNRESKAAPCIGDCNGDLEVTIDELLRGVSIAIGDTPLISCSVFDDDGSNGVTIDEIVRAVNAALNGCSAPDGSPTVTGMPTHSPTLQATPTATSTPTSFGPTATMTRTTPTVTVSPTASPAGCAPSLLKVAPLTSPTDQLTQVIHVASVIAGNSVSLSVSSAGASEYVEYRNSQLTQYFDILFPVLAGGTTQIDVCAQSTDCAHVACTHTDTAGNLLEIVQVVPTPRATLQTVTPTSSFTPTSMPANETPTPSPVDCGVREPAVGVAESPTAALTQTISGYVLTEGPYDYIEACSPAGCARTELLGNLMYYHPFRAEVPLAPGTVNAIEVCMYDNCGGRACQHAAVNGEPLIIEQISP